MAVRISWSIISSHRLDYGAFSASGTSTMLPLCPLGIDIAFIPGRRPIFIPDRLRLACRGEQVSVS